MRLFFCFLSTFLLSSMSFGQLDPFYFGTYIDDNFSAGYTIYTMDEVVDDCFLVEYERFENYQSVFGVSGFGHCEGENGVMEIQFEDDDIKTQVAFKIDEHGLKSMTILSGEDAGKVYREYNDFVPESGNEDEVASEEIYYSREDGSELIIYSTSDSKNLGFTIFSAGSDSCEGNGLEGVMKAMNEEMSLFEFQVNEKCRVEFQISTDSINLVEENCSGTHPESCGEWEGLYILNR